MYDGGDFLLDSVRLAPSLHASEQLHYPGNTKIVLGNPINSLIWLLNEIRKNNMILSFDFWVTTGSSTPIIPIKKGDLFSGSVKGLGSVSLKIS